MIPLLRYVVTSFHNDAVIRSRTAELKALRAELVKRLDQLDFRFRNIGPALAEMVRHVERTIRRLTMNDREGCRRGERWHAI
jgi:hypothetical protein